MLGRLEQVLSSDAAGAVVRARRSGSEVGDEVHDYLRSEAPCELRQASVVEDIADDAFRAKLLQSLRSFGRACETEDLVCAEVR